MKNKNFIYINYFSVIFFTFILSILPLDASYANTVKINKESSKKVENTVLVKKYSECKNEINCLVKYFSNNVNDQNLKIKLKEFNELMISDTVKNQCSIIGKSIGVAAYTNKVKSALETFSETCGHSYIYGYMTEFGNRSNPVTNLDILVKYCLNDPNPPSCSYGVGLSLGRFNLDPKKAEISCLKFSKYDSVRLPPESYQMTAVGDCVFGWSTESNSKRKDKDFATIALAISHCKGMVSKALIVCESSNISIYTQFGKNNNEKIDRLMNAKKFCQKQTLFECMQFIGKITDRFLNSYLSYSDKTTQGLNSTGDFLIKVCSGKYDNACLTGFIQSRIVESSKENVLNICKYLKNLSALCTKTTKEHG